MIYDLAAGKTLEQDIKLRRDNGKLMSESELLRTFAMVALALAHTHAQGQVHRNLSSAHIYLSSDGQIVRLASHANVSWKEWLEKNFDWILFHGEHYYLCP